MDEAHHRRSRDKPDKRRSGHEVFSEQDELERARYKDGDLGDEMFTADTDTDPEDAFGEYRYGEYDDWED